MLASTSSRDYVSLRNHPRDSAMSPLYRSRHHTPPRHPSNPSLYDSPMLTPSPLRQRLFIPDRFSVDLKDPDDLFIQSPYKPAVQVQQLHSTYSAKPQPITADDEDGSIFRSSSSTVFSPFFPASDSQPLRTPIKQIHCNSSRSALCTTHTAGNPDALPVARVGVGTKRKSTPHTPLRQHSLTPLVVASGSNSVAGAVLDRLAPLPAPKFAAGTPQTKAETDAYLHRQTATLTSLRITDLSDSVDEFGGPENDSGCEMDDEDEDVLFTGSVRLKGQTRRGLSMNKGKGTDEVVEAISPGGHVSKRRARSRPVSAELLESVQRSPPSQNKYASSTTGARQRTDGIAFPSVPNSRKWTPSSTSSCESGSPRPRRRVGNIHPHPPPKLLSAVQSTAPKPAMMVRQESAATLFFGPTIPSNNNLAPMARSRTNTALSSVAPSPHLGGLPPKMANRHSYAGPDSGMGGICAWNTIQTRSQAPSPGTSPQVPGSDRPGFNEDENMFFGEGPPDSSFVFSVTEGTPSPRSKQAGTAALPSKYKRDSGVVMSDEEDHLMSINDHLCVPAASTSSNSLYSDEEDNLVTPGIAPEGSSGWPRVFITGTDDLSGQEVQPGSRREVDIDAFIMRTLAAASKGPEGGKKKVPGTPVKRVKTAYLAERPWQSAVAPKIDRDDWDTRKGKVPRKSLPAAFPGIGQKAAKLTLDPCSDSEDDNDNSPSSRRDKYVGLGLGRPSASTPHDGLHLMSRTRWLMRRSSSGAFSTGNESQSSAETPTRVRGKDWHLPRVPVQFSPSNNVLKLSPARSAASSINRPAMIKPTGIPTLRQLPISTISRLQPPRQAAKTRRSSEPFTDEQPCRFDRDFVEVGEVGSGEFGKVIKVRRKDGDDTEVYAIKKSKRFEGIRHRLRLREEVEVLKHLSQVAANSSGGGRRHPNVLGYIDSWEEDEALYIQTELCESGNLARFLWEYGRVFPRLDEGRVWKIIVDLSNGLRFIHDAGVIHLDLKPSNVFVTREGRFKIGDFGMASLWPRTDRLETRSENGVFEREGDKLYLAPEVLQGNYSKAADVFSFGMTILETASNIVVPDQGEAWHRLRREDFSQVDLGDSPELLNMIRQMMRTDPSLRLSVHAICDHPVVSRARAIMGRVYIAAKRNGTSIFAASPLAGVHGGFLGEILDDRTSESVAMDLSA